MGRAKVLVSPHVCNLEAVKYFLEISTDFLHIADVDFFEHGCR
jgi:hypothetical protein